MEDFHSNKNALQYTVCPGGVYPGASNSHLARGVYPGVSALGCLPGWDSVYLGRGVGVYLGGMAIRGVVCPGGVYPGAICPGGVYPPASGQNDRRLWKYYLAVTSLLTEINLIACFALVSGGRSFSPPRPLYAPWPPRWQTSPSTSNASLTWRTCHSSYLDSTREGATSSAKQRTSSQKTFQNLTISSYEGPPCKTRWKIVVAICKEWFYWCNRDCSGLSEHVFFWNVYWENASLQDVYF